MLSLKDVAGSGGIQSVELCHSPSGVRVSLFFNCSRNNS